MTMLRGISQLLTKKSPYGNFYFAGLPALTRTHNYTRRSSIHSVHHQSFTRGALWSLCGVRSSSSHITSSTSSAPPMVELDYENLMQMTPVTLDRLRQAFMGNKAYGAIIITGIPEYAEKRRRAYRAGIDLALKDAEGRKKAAAVSNTYPGWSGTPGSETHPLQSSFLFNVKEEVGNGPDPYFGKNIFPSKEFQESFVDLAKPMHEAALQVLRGCDLLVEVAMGMEGLSWSSDGRSLHRLALDGPALAGRFICYDSAFTREDTMLDEKNSNETAPALIDASEAWQQNEDLQLVASVKPAGHAGDGLASMRTHSTPVKSAGHAGDGLASMRTHSTPVKSAGHAGDGLASMRTHSTPVKSAGHAGDGLASMRTHSTPVKSAGHAGDGLASMRTHSTPVKSAGHAGDGLASMRTHSTPVKSAGHAGDGLASMRTHSTPVKSAGHAGDGLASMRTHSTPVKSAGHAGDGLASMRTHSTPVKSAGHAGDGLASMRTHSTPVKSAGHAGDGLASMRTHSTPVKSAGHAGDGLASMRTHSTPVKSAGHAGDGLASMRTHSTPVKSAGHAGDGLASMRTHSTPVKTAGHAGDGLASMRTHSTPVKSAGHAGDGLASMRTHSTPVKSAGHAGDGLASMRTHSTPVKTAGHTGDGLASIPSPSMPGKSTAHAGEGFTSVRMHTTAVQADTSLGNAPFDLAAHSIGIIEPPAIDLEPSQSTSIIHSEGKKEVGDYWLPWHIDSNFVTLIHKEMYAYESDGSFAPDPEGAGVVFMNKDGDVQKLQTEDDGVMILQMGAFAQIYAGGHLAACRHAVTSPQPEGCARFNYCNFWYVPWDTVCEVPRGRERKAINTGWNAMMDESYSDITMRQSFAAFRQFMTSPEARVQFADSVRFKELSELIPLPTTEVAGMDQVVIDVMTDLRCPISYISLLNLRKALDNLNMSDQTVLRFHPVFLNPNVPKEGEALDDYLLREFGYSKEYARSDMYPLRIMGLEAGVDFSPDRRVVNTFDAACLVEIAQEHGKQHEMVEVLSRRYFEDAKDISQKDVLLDLAEEAGLKRSLVQQTLSGAPIRDRVAKKYQELNTEIGEVPHFVLRERISGNGVEAGGNRSVESWEAVIQATLEKGRFVGMPIAGLDGREVWMREANPTSPVSLAFKAQHEWSPTSWPYRKEDFSRMDESDDGIMYAEPRFVNHLDDSSLARLTEVYRTIFDAAGPGFSVLDLCSSWTSHFPAEMPEGARIVVHGLNEKELKANQHASEYHAQDLNKNPNLPYTDSAFDFVTMALSIQYLTDPRAVFTEMHRVLRPGGMAVVAFSHRSFLEKCVNVWAQETYDGEGHAHLISRYFQYGPKQGWAHLTSFDVSPRHGDPMWLVSAVKAK